MTEPFLRIPPFPGHRGLPLVILDSSAEAASADIDGVIDSLRRERVGGSFWGPQPELPPGRNLLIAAATREGLAELIGALDPDEAARAIVMAPDDLPVDSRFHRVSLDCDPWWIVDHVVEARASALPELELVAALAGKCPNADLTSLVQSLVLGGRQYRDPSDGQSTDAATAIGVLGQWRRLIDRNREYSAVYGIARWKRLTVDPLLWDGSGTRHHVPPERVGDGDRVIAWKTRTPPAVLERLQAKGATVVEIEDGMIRSSGLGANCVPPLSIVVDSSGIYFDPSTPSDLEKLLQHAEIDDEIRQRAAALRRQVVDHAISKYDQRRSNWKPAGQGRPVLVVGQVEDDRSMLTGGKGCSNLDLLIRARAMEPDAWLIYKPHPDVMAGHRRGHVDDAEVRRHADEVVSDVPISSLIDAVEGVHSITSLAGFEALLRGKAVTTHGVPFYAGWGLTRDLADLPERRTRKRTLDELVAATLILYPRYVDPVTRLPCSPELLIGRMVDEKAQISSPLIWLRSLQGRLQSIGRSLTGKL